MTIISDFFPDVNMYINDTANRPHPQSPHGESICLKTQLKLPANFKHQFGTIQTKKFLSRFEP
jgi:hypothetical protein